MNTARVNKQIRFYLGAVWVLYFNLAFAAVGVIINGPSYSGPNGAVLFISTVLAIPVSWFGVVLMILALVVFATVSKVREDIKRDATLGGWSAVAYPVLSVAWMFSFQLPFLGSWFFASINPVTFGVVLLVLHVVLMRRVKAKLAA